MEYPWRKPQETPQWYSPDFRITDGRIKVPKTAGMGLVIDPDFIRKAAIVAKIDNPKGTGSSHGTGSSNG